jgi:hypothetical protein
MKSVWLTLLKAIPLDLITQFLAAALEKLGREAANSDLAKRIYKDVKVINQVTGAYLRIVPPPDSQ